MEFNTEEAQAAAAQFRESFNRIKSEIQKFMVGQEDIIDHVLISVICGGNVLLEGVPGLGKTALVHTLAQTLSLDFSRIFSLRRSSSLLSNASVSSLRSVISVKKPSTKLSVPVSS